MNLYRTTATVLMTAGLAATGIGTAVAAPAASTAAAAISSNPPHHEYFWNASECAGRAAYLVLQGHTTQPCRKESVLWVLYYW